MFGEIYPFLSPNRLLDYLLRSLCSLHPNRGLCGVMDSFDPFSNYLGTIFLIFLHFFLLFLSQSCLAFLFSQSIVSCILYLIEGQFVMEGLLRGFNLSNFIVKCNGNDCFRCDGRWSLSLQIRDGKKRDAATEMKWVWCIFGNFKGRIFVLIAGKGERGSGTAAAGCDRECIVLPKDQSVDQKPSWVFVDNKLFVC